MAAQIHRRKKAAEDAEELAAFIANSSSEAAIRFLECAEATLSEAARSPGSGSPFLSHDPRLANLRFRRVKGFPNHLIFYIPHDDSIEVVRILHGARDLDAELTKD